MDKKFSLLLQYIVNIIVLPNETDLIDEGTVVHFIFWYEN